MELGIWGFIRWQPVSTMLQTAKHLLLCSSAVTSEQASRGVTVFSVYELCNPAVHFFRYDTQLILFLHIAYCWMKEWKVANSRQKNLEVKFDSGLKSDKQMNRVVKWSLVQLRIVSKLRSVLSSSDLERVIHAFVSSRLDYCSSLYFGIAHCCLSPLHLVQNAAAGDLTKKREHITPVLASLHWLPVSYGANFNILMFVYKVLQWPRPFLRYRTPLPVSRCQRPEIIGPKTSVCPGI